MGRTEKGATGASVAEDLFIGLFCDVFGPEKAQYLYLQYPFVDIYGNHRYIDFALENELQHIAIEIDGEAYHNPAAVSRNKHYDDLLKQNSIIYRGWQVYRWAFNQLKDQPENVKDELQTFLGEHPLFKAIEDYLPQQRGQVLELKEHQVEALEHLRAMRAGHETIALLYHATGTGKTVTAVSDAKRVGKRTLFLAHTRELVNQARETFAGLWPEADTGIYMEAIKQRDSHVVCGSIQSVALNLSDFRPDDFGYLIIDECHHGTAETYQRVLGYFRPEFTLGLTATPERADGDDLLESFRKVAHKLELKTAVEIGELVPVRCIRIRTNIDLSLVRMNGVRYHARDLESKLFVPERNQLIVDTWTQYVRDKKTVVFCSSVRHAEEIAGLFRNAGIAAMAVSGSMKGSDRKEVLDQYEEGEIRVLCACDLLNEGWDSPRTEVLFMARPTLSKTLYIQQLGRGMRTADGKECLVVFDFVDNANMFNMAYSMHRLLNLKGYQPGKLVLGPVSLRQVDEDLYNRGEIPAVMVDYPINAMDYEVVDLFNWQEEVRDMVSQMEFVRRVDVQAETVERYLREGKITPDLVVPIGESRSFKYFKEETVEKYATEYGWTLITPQNMKDLFMEMVKTMDMAYSYKPVLLKAIFAQVDRQGRVKLSDIVQYFISYYEDRRARCLPVEKKASIFAKGEYTRKAVERNILINPFKRFEDMSMMKHARDLGSIEINAHVFKKLTDADRQWISAWCDKKLAEYYSRRRF